MLRTRNLESYVCQYYLYCVDWLMSCICAICLILRLHLCSFLFWATEKHIQYQSSWKELVVKLPEASFMDQKWTWWWTKVLWWRWKILGTHCRQRCCFICHLVFQSASSVRQLSIKDSKMVVLFTQRVKINTIAY